MAVKLKNYQYYKAIIICVLFIFNGHLKLFIIFILNSILYSVDVFQNALFDLGKRMEAYVRSGSFSRNARYIKQTSYHQDTYFTPFYCDNLHMEWDFELTAIIF